LRYSACDDSGQTCTHHSKAEVDVAAEKLITISSNLHILHVCLLQ
jgi:hypothetical protein